MSQDINDGDFAALLYLKKVNRARPDGKVDRVRPDGDWQKLDSVALGIEAAQFVLTWGFKAAVVNEGAEEWRGKFRDYDENGVSGNAGTTACNVAVCKFCGLVPQRKKGTHTSEKSSRISHETCKAAVLRQQKRTAGYLRQGRAQGMLRAGVGSVISDTAHKRSPFP